ncbi:MAG: SAM-dependent methyltransferase [Bacteroidales bacterium]|nr:SAM-dependent methyltransferase [Bacteroidales bacterium]
MSETLQKFLDRVAESAEQSALVKMTLSKPANRHDDLRNVYVKPVLIKEKRLFAFTYHYDRRDEVKNYAAAQMADILQEMLPARFQNAVLFTVNEDVTLLVSAKGKATLQTKKVQENREQNLDHDRQKTRLINPANPWWYQLGLTTREGKITADMQHKFKQIYKYAEIVESLVKPMKFGGTVHIADMGAGKGYLTFALHEVLTHRLHLDVDIKGVEIRPDLVLKINEIIKADGLKGLEFVESSIEAYHPEKLDVLIALHACNTATDDAIASGIKAGAELIVCAPCCHKQIRQEMERAGRFDAITRYGIFLERQAVMITDTIRALILEYFGYKTQVMEFIEMEHTPKNVLLVGRKTSKVPDKSCILQQINELKARYGIGRHYLEETLGMEFS